MEMDRTTKFLVNASDTLFKLVGLGYLVEDNYAHRMAHRNSAENKREETVTDNSVLSLFNININVPVGGRVTAPEGDVMRLTL